MLYGKRFVMISNGSLYLQYNYFLYYETTFRKDKDVFKEVIKYFYNDRVSKLFSVS